MDIQDQHPVNEAPPAHGAAPANHARRRFARAGLGASGVILTLASQPGMAATRVCKSPSGSLSGGLQSRPTDQTLVCGGLSPGYWKNHEQHKWPGSVCPVDRQNKLATTFKSVYPGGAANSVYDTLTLLQMLEDNAAAGDTYNVGMHLAAAFLNVKSGNISYLTVTSLQNMWYALITYGYYTPHAGIQWGAEQIKLYLESTEGDAP